MAHDAHRKINRTHDAVAELLLHQFLDGRAVDADDLIPAVHRGEGVRVLLNELSAGTKGRHDPALVRRRGSGLRLNGALLMNPSVERPSLSP